MAGGLSRLCRLYAGLSTPAVILDAAHRLVYLNPRAEEFWHLPLAAGAGRLALRALRLRPPEGRRLRAWGQAVVVPACAAGEPFAAMVREAGGGLRAVMLSAARFRLDGAWYAAVIVLPEAVAPDGGAVSAPPDRGRRPRRPAGT